MSLCETNALGFVEESWLGEGLFSKAFSKSDVETAQAWIQAIGFPLPHKGNIFPILEFKIK